MSDEILSMIPGMYRLRLKLTQKNKQIPINPDEEVSDISEEENKVIKNENNHVSKKYENDIEKALQMSMNEYNVKNEEEIECDDVNEELFEAIFNSLKSNTEEDNLDLFYSKSDISNNKLSELSDDEIILDSDESIIEDEIILDSDSELEFKISDDSTNFDGFYVCLDLRYYGRSLYAPIHVHGEKFYLNPIQIKMVSNSWEKINPESDSGLLFVQNREYERALVKDMT